MCLFSLQKLQDKFIFNFKDGVDFTAIDYSLIVMEVNGKKCTCEDLNKTMPYNMDRPSA